jgi:crotonobetainyl-CoA:carnitine CoA-transferase CaiB-like acyl-CoA transferase
LAALYRRGNTGEGGLVDVPMIDGQAALLTYHASSLLNADVAPQRLGNHHPSIHPYGTYRANDGHINIAVGNDRLFRLFAKAIGKVEWNEDPRFETNASRVAHRGALDTQIDAVMAEASVEHWCGVLAKAGVPAGPINSVADAVAEVELVEHPHPAGQGVVRSTPLPYRLDGAPRASPLAPPSLGQHTSEVLKDWLDSP